MSPPDRHLLDLFFRLREQLGLPLQVEDYELLVEAWEANFQPDSHEALKRLCRRLWVKSPADQQRFDEYFDSYLAELFYQAFQRSRARTPASQPPVDPEDRLDPVSDTASSSSPPSAPPPPPPPTRQPRSRPNLQVVQAVVRGDSLSERVPLGKYNLSDEYFPVKRRELRHGWRRLRQPEYAGWSEEWDMPAVVQQISQQGLLLNPVYLPAKVNRANLLLLIDRSNSMDPFDLVAERLIATASRAANQDDFSRVQVCYFRNAPTSRLFQDRDLSQPLLIDELLPQLSEQHTVAVVFSDGGAARKGFNPRRCDLTADFVNRLKPQLRQMAWLNPLARHRWPGTSAERIAQDLPMFALSQHGWRGLLKELRGQGQLIGQQPSQPDSPDAKPRDAVSEQRLIRQLQSLVQASPQPEKYAAAIDRVVYWASKDDTALTLLGHWAFPLALTPDLLYYLRENFVPDSPWSLGADLLLSGMCRTVGYQLYEIDPLIRHLALKWLVVSETGHDRLHQLSDSLLYYMQHRLEGTQRLPRDFGEKPEWIALAYTEPNALATEIAQKLRANLSANNLQGQIRLASLATALAEPLAEANFQPVLVLARAMGRLARGDEAGAEILLGQLSGPMPADLQDIASALTGEPAAAAAPSDWLAANLSVLTLKTARFVEDAGAIDPDFPPILTEAYEVVMIEVAQPDVQSSGRLEPFEFEIATLEWQQPSRRGGFLRNRFQQQPSGEWVSRRRRGQGRRWLEPLGDELVLEMVALPSGSFVMGSPKTEPERSDNEGPQHEVNVPAFFMSRYPITQAQWRSVVELPQEQRALNPAPSRFKGDMRPVESVSWDDAMEFCARLSTHTGREYRLPGEAEWEYACRAGTTTPFHFGETITTDLANYRGTDDKSFRWKGNYGTGPKGKYRAETTPVDHFKVANAFGLCDMHGNVWEWCLDHWHGSYDNTQTDGSAWLTEDENAFRVLRGGSWYHFPGVCRSASRIYASREYRYSFNGFRVVSVAPRTLP
ncbi:MAG: SUMF1/EgtB/PvdO family nonheme iron enzyme [Cyanobacteria bacterium J06639_14]